MTRTVTVYMPGPWASVGVQVKLPPVVMAAPAGAPASRVKVRVLAGRSASVAVAVKLIRASSLPLWLPMARQHRGGVDFVDGDLDGLEVIQGRRAVVGDAHGDGVDAGPLGFGRRPGEGAAWR